MRASGTVKWFDDQKWLAFITREDGQAECFVHRSAIQSQSSGSLNRRERVAFEIVDSHRGPAAENVTRLP
jgi:cold shock protein